MQCPRCNTPLEDAAVFCGQCGMLLRPQSGSEFATVNDASNVAPTVVTRPNSPTPATAHPQSYDQIDPQSTISANRSPFGSTPNIQQQYAQPNNMTPVYPYPGTPPAQQPLQSRGKWRKLPIFLLLAVVIVGGAVASAILYTSTRPTSSPAVIPTGQVSFFDSQNSIAGDTDALKITASGLSNPSAGNQYDAWLIDTDNEQILSLGTLSKSGKSFVLTYSQAGKNLIGAGNQIEITQEQGQPSEPSGNPLLTGTFPPQAFVHIRHLLTRFPTTPNNIGLLVGLLDETQKLNAQAALLENNTGSYEGQVRQCIAQSMIDIIEGTNGADYSTLSGWCAAQNIMEIGDGFGLLDPGNTPSDRGYLVTAAQHAALAANQPDSTDLIRRQAKKVETSIDNIRTLLQQIKGDALTLLSNPSGTSQVAEIVTRSNHAYYGFDQNGNGVIEPVIGEAGAITAYTQGQLMATLTLSP
jgi:hypothetical protein